MGVRGRGRGFGNMGRGFGLKGKLLLFGEVRVRTPLRAKERENIKGERLVGCCRP